MEKFIENTTIHGVYYLKIKSKAVRILWLILIIAAAISIIISTGLMVKTYFLFDNYIINEEIELDQLDSLPNILVCSNDRLSLVEPILKIYPNLSMTSLINDEFIKNLLNDYLKKWEFRLENCKLNVRNQVFNCNNSYQLVYTFTGICLMIDVNQINLNSLLLSPEFHILNDYEPYVVQLTVTFNSTIYDKLHFKLLDRNDQNAIKIYSFVKNEILFKKYTLRTSIKFYDVISTYEKYTEVLHDKKCFLKGNNLNTIYDEILCHYECLQSMIASYLRCYFSLSENKALDRNLPYCTLKHLTNIEYIIANYSELRENFNLCKPCLPNCIRKTFTLRESYSPDYGTIKKGNGFSWNFNIQFKALQINHVLKFDSAQFLSFMNGLWSLFLGISILSLWEVVDLIIETKKFKNFTKNKFKFVAILSFKRFQQSKFLKKAIKYIKFAFHDTYLHGFKNIFDTDSSKISKFLLFIVISITGMGFFYSCKGSIDELTKYETNYETSFKQLNKNDKYLKRKLTFLVCTPLIINKNYEELYANLTLIANSLYEKQIRNQSELKFHYLAYLNKEEFNEKNKTIDLYLKIFTKLNFEMKIELLPISTFLPDQPDFEVEKSAYFNLNEECSRINVNLTIKEWNMLLKNAKIVIEWLSYYNSTAIKIQRQVTILDSESLHASDKSWYIDSNQVLNLNAALKYRKILPHPFKPGCNSSQGYRQQKCYADCFDNLIYKQFGCRVVLSEFSSIENYCHPLLIPLIVSYEKYVLRQSSKNTLCKNCKPPCEVYYYDLEITKDLFYTELKFNDHVELIQQIPIRTLEDTLIILISYFSLFFGGSLLAIIQICFNLAFGSKLENNNKQCGDDYNNKTSIIDVLSQIRSIHCIKYISSLIKSAVTRRFWRLIIIIIVLIGIVYSSIEARKYVISEPNSYKNEISNSYRMPKIDICYKRYLSYNAVVKELWAKDMLDEVILSNKNLSYLNIKRQVSIIHQIYAKHMILLKEKNLTKYLELQSMNWHREIIETMNSFDLNVLHVVDANSDTLSKKLNLSSTFYEMSVLYSNEGLEISLCKTIDWSQLNITRVTYNPFIKVPINIINFISMKSGYEIYINNFHIYSSKGLQLYYGSYKDIKSFIENFDYKYACEYEDECIFDTKFLNKFNEYQLYLCNSEFMQAIHEIFNCTPFISSNSAPRCSLTEAIIIDYIFREYKEFMFDCETSSASFPIELDHVFTQSVFDDIISIDLNGVIAYKADIFETYDLLKLIVNISNMLNVLIGMSFLTFFEILYLLAKYKIFYRNLTVHNQ